MLSRPAQPPRTGPHWLVRGQRTTSARGSDPVAGKEKVGLELAAFSQKTVTARLGTLAPLLHNVHGYVGFTPLHPAQGEQGCVLASRRFVVAPAENACTCPTLRFTGVVSAAEPMMGL